MGGILFCGWTGTAMEVFVFVEGKGRGGEGRSARDVPIQALDSREG